MKRTSILTAVLLFSAAYAAALPPQTGFFLGAGYGTSALNNDVSIYSCEANSRQPSMNINQTNKSRPDTKAVSAGYNFASAKTVIMNASLFQLGVEGDYADLGKYTSQIRYDVAPFSAYRSIEEQSASMLLTSALYWENGFNLFLKTGVARLQGKYAQQGLITARTPSAIPGKETFKYAVYRPELALGTGVLLFNHLNLHVQYTAILGPTPKTGSNRFGSELMMELPNTLQRAESLTAGITYFF